MNYYYYYSNANIDIFQDSLLDNATKHL